MRSLCFAAVEDITTYIKEVPIEVEEHIIGKVFALLESGYANNVIATQLSDDMNKKYGDGWQVISSVNVSLKTLNVNHERNGLFYFSFAGIHFYIFKQLGSTSMTNASNCTSQVMQTDFIHF